MGVIRGYLTRYIIIISCFSVSASAVIAVTIVGAVLLVMVILIIALGLSHYKTYKYVYCATLCMIINFGYLLLQERKKKLVIKRPNKYIPVPGNPCVPKLSLSFSHYFTCANFIHENTIIMPTSVWIYPNFIEIYTRF